MNFNLLNKLVSESNLGKSQIAELANMSRTTLDNALNGADVRVSTIETLAKVLGVRASVFFAEDDCSEPSVVDKYVQEIERLKSLLNEQKKSAKVVVELDVTQDEFIKMGLKDKVIQILNKE